VDGWRLDVAYEIGPTLLGQLTEAAHREKPGSLVVGEIWNYPAGWMPAMDGVMNFHWRALLLGLVRGEISAANASTMIGRTVGDLGIEPLLKSWVLLDNHDVRRVHTELPDTAQRRLAQVLQFTLPGSPNLYYGAEVGMTGGDDPAQRGPMRWDLVRADHPEMLWTKQLVNLRKQHRALRVGNYRTATAEKLLAFERYTDRAADTVLVLANPSDQPVTESVQWRNGAMMDFNTLRDLLPPPAGSAPAIVSAGFVRTTVPPRSVRVLAPDVGAQGGYTVYKRVNCPAGPHAPQPLRQRRRPRTGRHLRNPGGRLAHGRRGLPGAGGPLRAQRQPGRQTPPVPRPQGAARLGRTAGPGPLPRSAQAVEPRDRVLGR
jgi:hypothetical protein